MLALQIARGQSIDLLHPALLLFFLLGVSIVGTGGALLDCQLSRCIFRVASHRLRVSFVLHCVMTPARVQRALPCG